MTSSLFKKFLMFKLPIAYIAGLKLAEISENKAVIKVKLSFFNQNPFKSMFWAVQGMAAELSTGVMCVDKIQSSKQAISMLVIEQNAKFTKKAVGTIYFTCLEGQLITETIQKAIDTKEGQTVWLNSKGVDEKGDMVAEFNFLWSFKTKN